jgi:hypothetical protein
VQASNLPGLGLLTYGECWHNNHHAFPESARIGLERGQVDPGWWVVRTLERLGLAWNVGHPRPPGSREDLIDINSAERLPRHEPALDECRLSFETAAPRRPQEDGGPRMPLRFFLMLRNGVERRVSKHARR